MRTALLGPIYSNLEPQNPDEAVETLLCGNLPQ